MGATTREEKIRMLAYFWDEKRDIERWVGFDRDDVARYAPEILSTWDAFKQAEANMTTAVKVATGDEEAPWLQG